jgi:hypothetical protein
MPHRGPGSRRPFGHVFCSCSIPHPRCVPWVAVYSLTVAPLRESNPARHPLRLAASSANPGQKRRRRDSNARDDTCRRLRVSNPFHYQALARLRDQLRGLSFDVAGSDPAWPRPPRNCSRMGGESDSQRRLRRVTGFEPVGPAYVPTHPYERQELPLRPPACRAGTLLAELRSRVVPAVGVDPTKLRI